jgi:hypothetical protein
MRRAGLALLFQMILVATRLVARYAQFSRRQYSHCQRHFR